MRNLPPLCNNRAESNRVGRYPYSYHRCSSTGRKTGWYTESCCSYGTKKASLELLETIETPGKIVQLPFEYHAVI